MKLTEKETGLAVTVKPLEWQDRGLWPAVEPGSGFGPAWSEAYPPVGESFHIYSLDGGKSFFGAGMVGVVFHTLDEAKADAQADYARRILSALVTSPPLPEPDPLAMARALVDDIACAMTAKAECAAKSATEPAGRALLAEEKRDGN